MADSIGKNLFFTLQSRFFSYKFVFFYLAPSDVIKNQALKALRAEIQNEHISHRLDGFGLYLYGVVLKKLDLKKMALDILLEAIHAEPLHWGAWLELAALITDKDMVAYLSGLFAFRWLIESMMNILIYEIMDSECCHFFPLLQLNSLSLPNVWIKEFFLAHAYLELQLNEEALTIYNTLRENGFSDSTYVMAQIAISYHNMRGEECILKYRVIEVLFMPRDFYFL